MEEESYKHSELTEKIIKAFYTVYNRLGYGFLEKVYENAMLIELRKMGLKAEAQQLIRVYYEGEQVGLYSTDIVVEDYVAVELKAAESLSDANEAQLINFLKATDKEVGLLLNFGIKAQVKRKVFSNQFKTLLNK